MWLLVLLVCSSCFCNFVLVQWYNAGHQARKAIVGGLVQLLDDPRSLHERVWTWPVVNRSGEMCGFAVKKPRGDSYVEALTDYSFYAQTVREENTIAYPGEVKGNDVQFSEVFYDDFQAVHAAMGRFGVHVDVNSCHNFFQERIALPQTGGLWDYGRLTSPTSGPEGPAQVRTRPVVFLLLRDWNAALQTR